MLTYEEISTLFRETFKDCDTHYEISDMLKTMSTDKNIEALRRYFCNDVLYLISTGYTKYNPEQLKKNKLVNLLCDNIELLPNDLYYQAVYAFFKHDEKKCLDCIEKMFARDYVEYKDKIKSPDEFANEFLVVDLFFEPLKAAFNGFWGELSNIIRKYPCQEGLPELCEVIEQYYSSNTDEEALEILLAAVQKYPKLILIKELTGYTYYSMKLWNNAIAYFESVDGENIFFRNYDLHFMLGWSYGKIKNHKEEEKYYRKSLEEDPGFINTLNNLGYCLYQQKRYTEAKEYFEECLKLNKEYIYASNNYVRVLIALGRNKDAKDFINSGQYKVSKDIQKRVEKLDNSNARITKTIVNDAVEHNGDENSQENAIDLGIKRQQFSNEKLLEDELTARIESGIEVFGLKLKIYKRKGVYGRQYIIPIGRLDLLCEDDKGDLYIIELKKDSGYDDAYAQTVAYIDWFDSSPEFKNKNIKGIICLNSPTKKLIDDVRNDDRISLFEYQISYTEVK